MRLKGKEIEEVCRRAEVIHGEKLKGTYAVGGALKMRCPLTV